MAARLGPVQQHVLLVLSTRGPSACTDWSAWYPLRTEEVRGAMDRLGRRGLVDVHGWSREHGRECRTFHITDAGLAAVAECVGIDEEAI